MPAPHRPLTRRRLAPGAVGVLLAIGGLVLSACGGSGSKPAADAAAPPLTVVATNWPLSELAHEVGGSHVRVTDLAQGATDDRALSPTPAQTQALAHAQLVVEVGGGWQPKVEAAAGTGARVLALGHQRSATGSQVWLDPPSMEQAATALGNKLEALDPAAAGAFRNGVRDFNANMASVGVDYQSSLGNCQYQTLFVPDDAFGAMAAQYSLRLHVVAAGGVTAATAAARAQSYHGLFAEPPLPASQMTQLAAQGKAKLGELDTMDGLPIKTEPANSTYVDRLEANLKYLTGGLYCQEAGIS